MIENIFQPAPFLRVFPAVEDVFSATHAFLAKHLHPVLSIDLSAVDPQWKGWVHMLNPAEPYEAYMGDHTGMFHNEYVRENWISFSLDEAGRYEFLGDRRYFFIENDDARAESDGYRPELEKHYIKQQSSYEAAIQRYREFGGLYRPKRFKPLEKAESDAKPMNLLDQLGGPVTSGNWASYPPPPATFVLDGKDDDHVTIKLSTGEAFAFIAGVPGYHYRDSGADWILLFYEPKNKIALMTFDWT